MRTTSTRSRPLQSVMRTHAISTPDNVSDIDRRIELLTKHKDELFGIESDSAHRLKHELTVLRTARERPGIKLLDSSVLSWRWRQQMRRGVLITRYVPVPKLALLSLDSPHCIFRVDSNGRWSYPEWERIPAPTVSYLARCEDIRLKLAEIAENNRGAASLRFRWRGHIPLDAREIISEANASGMFDEIHLLAEAPKEDWKLFEQPGPPRQLWDPLILGRKGDLYFILGKFDPTTLEDYVAEEFAT